MELNKEILEKVAQWLEAGAPHEQSRGMGFAMQYLGVDADDYFEQLTMYEGHDWIKEGCKTVGCIAGAVVQFSGQDPTVDGIDVELEANKILYGTNDYGNLLGQLFYPEFYKEGRTAFDATPAEAAVAVRHFMEHEDPEAAWAAAGFTRYEDEE